ncbi:MAG: exodeoxyribonuclease VII large subunit [Proteobacteria bacterium]|nr:exodeoxyribonuclease VII large subunit [Pseudomonadota bacterium]
MAEPKSNAPELSVSDLAGALKRTIEDAFGHVRLRGEISGYRGPHSSGHVYFSLKDASARIDAVIWKGVFGRLRIRPEEGMEVIASGKITTFPGKSSYQIVIDSLEPAGVGALMALLEERKRKLGAEGLFEPARKQLLPYLPRVIGVVTSPTGAVIRDILHRLADRFPRHVLVWPVRVQGETSAAEVAAAINGFNALSEGGRLPRPDVLIVARGGGSLEDLWGFNEEVVVRAAAMSDIPLIAAVGHETDWTLIDLAADVRAPTPTAAAEMAVPVRTDLLATTRDLAARLTGAVARGFERRRTDLRSAARALPDAEALLATPRQRLDMAALRLGSATRSRLERRRQTLQGSARRLMAQRPEARLARFVERLRGLSARLEAMHVSAGRERTKRLETLAQRLETALKSRLILEKRDLARGRERVAGAGERLAKAMAALKADRARRLAGADALLNSLGYRQVLARGYALVRDGEGKPLRSAAGIAAGAALAIEFADGKVQATVGDGGRKPATRSAKTSGPGGQGSLF